MAPRTPESINESIAHQSTLNVEVPEFRPKIVLQPTTNGFANKNYRHNNKKTFYNKNEARETTRRDESSHKKQIKSTNVTARKPLTDKKLQTASTVPVVNGDDSNNVNNSSNNIKTNATNNSSNIKKRTTNPVLEKKILIESTKNIEMQNIDLMKSKSEPLSSRKDDVKIETTWVVVGGKRKMIQEEIPIEREKTETVENDTIVNGAEPMTNGVTIDSSPATTAALTKKASRKSKQKNKTQAKRNASQQGKNTKLQGFVIEEPTFTPVAIQLESEPEPEMIESDIEEPLTQEIVNTLSEEADTPESDTEELQEAALIEEIPWTDADIEEMTKAAININETEQEKARDVSFECVDEQNQTESELDQTKAEHILIIPKIEIIETEEADTSCSSQINESLVKDTDVEQICFDNPTDFEDMLSKEIEVQTKVVAGKNGLTCHPVGTETRSGTEDLSSVEEMICEKVTTVSQSNPKIVFETPIEAANADDDDAAILEINETQSEKYFLTAAVCNWLHTFNNNDLQSLFTIPLSADFVKKIKYCSEISKYFADDELQNLDKFINENFCQYQQLSACSSLSSLLSDMSGSSDDEDDTAHDDDKTKPTSEHTQEAIRSAKSTKKALKIFGCEIM